VTRALFYSPEMSLARRAATFRLEGLLRKAVEPSSSPALPTERFPTLPAERRVGGRGLASLAATERGSVPPGRFSLRSKESGSS